MKIFEKTVKYLEMGFSVVPVSLTQHPKKSDKVNKKPLKNWKQYQQEYVTRTVLETKWKKNLDDGPGRGVAIITGELSDLIVVDMDDKQAIDLVKNKLPEGFLTPLVKTGRGGYHLYFKYRLGLKNTAGLGNTGLDVRTEGGLVVAPPSQFPANWGTHYHFAEGRGLDDIEIASMPEDLFNMLVDLINKYEPAGGKGKRGGAGRQNWFIEEFKGVPEGQRIHTLTRLCGNMYRLRIDKQQALEMLKAWNQSNKPPEEEETIKKQFESTWKNIDKKHSKIVEDLNQHYSIIDPGNCVRIMYVHRDGELSFYKRADFRLKLENQRVAAGKKTISVADIWLQSEYRKDYEKCVFEPNGASPDCYNLWRGFAVKPKAGKWNLYYNHIRDNFGKKHTDWIIKWMARIVQDPGGERPGTSIVLRGMQGTGKGVFANNFGVLFGNHYTIVNNMQHVTGRFNKDLANTVLLYIDEATWGGDFATAGQLKNLITEPERRVESKGVDAFYVKNHLNLIISSNNKWVVPSGPKERRFLVLDMENERIQDKAYFGAIINQLRDGGYEAMMHDLLQVEYDMDEIGTVPITEATREQSLKSLDFVDQFWHERLYEGTLVDNHDFWKYRVVTEKFYQQYIFFCSERNFNRKIENKSTFIKTIRTLCSDIVVKTARHGKETFKSFFIPDLEACRKAFDNYMEILGANPGKWPEIAEPDNVEHKDRLRDIPGTFRKT